MPTPTYTPLANITLASSAASVTFSSISQAYSDLVLVVSPIDAAGFSNVRVQVNGDTGSNYYWVRMLGDGSAAASSSGTTGGGAGGAAYVVSSTERMSSITQIMDYSATDKHKTILTREDSPAYNTVALATRWANTAAITSLKVLGGTYAAGSTFALYGIAA